MKSQNHTVSSQSSKLTMSLCAYSNTADHAHLKQWRTQGCSCFGDISQQRFTKCLQRVLKQKLLGFVRADKSFLEFLSPKQKVDACLQEAWLQYNNTRLLLILLSS